MYDQGIEELNQECFTACDQPPVKISQCYLTCYAETIQSLNKAQLMKPWVEAFDKCPFIEDSATDFGAISEYLQ